MYWGTWISVIHRNQSLKRVTEMFHRVFQLKWTCTIKQFLTWVQRFRIKCYSCLKWVQRFRIKCHSCIFQKPMSSKGADNKSNQWKFMYVIESGEYNNRNAKWQYAKNWYCFYTQPSLGNLTHPQIWQILNILLKPSISHSLFSLQYTEFIVQCHAF